MDIQSDSSQEKQDSVDEFGAHERQSLLGFLQQGGPWMISTLVHVALVIVALLIVWSSITKSTIENVIVPESDFSDNPQHALSVARTDTKMTSSMSKRSLVKKPQQMTVSQIVNTSSNLSYAGGSIAGGNPFGAAINGQGHSDGIFGQPPRGNARKIVYLIDASGSLISSIPFVITELKRAIHKLSDKQSFTIIFFQGNKVVEWRSAHQPQFGLRPASSKFKKEAVLWIDPTSGHVVPRGEGNPINAIKLALKYQPELMYVLSDNITGSGQWEINQASLITQFEAANLGKTIVNTIQFLYDDPLIHHGKQPTLKLLAEKTHGKYKFVSGQELGIHMASTDDNM